MLTKQELLNLMADIESDRVERTESLDKTDKFGEAICAFANDLPNHRAPGYLLIGVRKDGTLSGLKVDERLLESLGGFRSDGNILPIPAMTVSKISLNDGDMAIVEVLPADMPPVRYKQKVKIRIGPRRGDASEQEERILTEKRISHIKHFDGWPCQGSSVADLALGQFDSYRRNAVDAEVIANNHRTIEEQLSGLRFLDPSSGCPTNAGILLFGKNPLYFLPGAYVQYLVFPSTSAIDVPTGRTVDGDLASMLQTLESIIASHVSGTPVKESSLRERMVYNVPEFAVRELLMNALMHRDYQSNVPVRFYWFSDRIEIMSPGGLFGLVRTDNFGRASDYRNPTIAEAMNVLGYVNRYGYGVQRAQALLKENGSSPAVFNFDEPDSVSVIIPLRAL
jgi:ATP-dependent DNA helicase RecG